MPESPNLLFFSPVFPASSGNGLAMRASAMVKALSRDVAVHLVSPEGNEGEPPADCASWVGIPALRHRLAFGWIRSASTPPPEWAEPSPELVQQLQTWMGDRSFTHLHVFRLYMLPLALAVCRGRQSPPPKLHLDLDDLESDTRAGMAQVAPSMPDRRVFRHAAAFYRRKEEELLPECDAVYVCNAEDRDLLVQRGLGRVHVVPNIYPAAEVLPLPEPSGPFTFLFVGNWNHIPNLDGLEVLVTRILPVLRSAAERPFRILVAGSGRMPRVLSGRKCPPDIEWAGWVEHMESVYRQAHATVVPLRCGGGTRIKILESFAWGRPVISTPAGARGLEVKPGQHLLMAADPEGFAAACVEIMTSASLRRNLAAQAGAWVREYASPPFLRARLTEAMDTE